MMGCTNEATHWAPRSYGTPEVYHVEIKKECGRIGYTGEPVYCRECRDVEARRGFAKHQCRHGVDLYPEDGRDIPCGLCEGGA